MSRDSAWRYANGFVVYDAKRFLAATVNRFRRPETS